MKIPAEGDHGFTRGMLANDLAEALVKDDEFGGLFGHIGDSDVERALPAFLAALPSYEDEPVLPVGTVLRTDSPEPPDGTWLIIRVSGGPKLIRYSPPSGLRGAEWWARWVADIGPVVVAPNYYALTGDAE